MANSMKLKPQVESTVTLDRSIVVAGLEGGAIRCDAKMARAMDSKTVRINHKTINYSSIVRS
jgi:hypothetical protein